MSDYPSKARLYDAMGEVIYGLALADGLIQPEETEKLHELLRAHPWSKEIQWSFEFEQDHQHQLEETYQKAVDVFKAYGPSSEYAFLFELLEAVAEASDGVERRERTFINRLRSELLDHFQKLDLKDLREE